LTRLVSYLLALALLLPVPGFSQSEKQYINIGLLLPDNSHSDIIEAAELAIEEANRAGGYMNQEFRVLVRTTEGFWGAGSKESVSLVYEDNVRAIVGYLDGRNGHLAEQVATKSHLSYIETFATEPTLSQAFVPWFMRVVPNDNQQALAIIKQIQKEDSGKICILTREDYDTRYAVKSLTKTLARESGKTAVLISLEKTGADQEALLEKILLNETEHLIIPFEDASMNRIIGKLREQMPELKVYGTLHFSMGVEKRNEDWKLHEGLYIIKPLTRPGEDRILSESRSAYVYDAVSLVIRAVRQAGTDRGAITEYISKSTYPEGATGSISFDELGNREDAARLFHIKNGIAHELKLP
jgi:ABC-type branched-subunit amino acid transport system substrate-binding protein